MSLSVHKSDLAAIDSALRSFRAMQERTSDDGLAAELREADLLLNRLYLRASRLRRLEKSKSATVKAHRTDQKQKSAGEK